MTELRNVEADLSRFRARVLVASVVVVLAFLLLAARLVYLQVVRHADLDEQAENNRTAVVPIVPNRGLILDRNGVVLATNYSAYTLEITPSRVQGGSAALDAVIDQPQYQWRLTIPAPGIDGATLITGLRSDPQFARSRLIVVTALDEAQRAPYAFALDGVPVVHKPQLVRELPPLLAPFKPPQ